MKIETISNIRGTQKVKMLVYGGSGVGKTMLAATAPTPFIISAESGLLSISEKNQMRVFGKSKNIPFVSINTLDELNDVYKWALSSKEASHIETICLDSLTEIAEVVLSAMKSRFKDPRQAYGELIERTTQLVRGFRDLPNHHIYFSAKEEKYKDELAGTVLHGPSMPGAKLGPSLPYLFDEVFQLAIGSHDGKKYRYLLTQPTFQQTAKDRSGLLEDVETPNIESIINKITK